MSKGWEEELSDQGGRVQNEYRVVESGLHYLCRSDLEGKPGRLVEVDHLDSTTLFAVCPHGPLAVRSCRARHTKLRNLRAVLTMVSKRGASRLNETDGLLRAVGYW